MAVQIEKTKFLSFAFHFVDHGDLWGLKEYEASFPSSLCTVVSLKITYKDICIME